MNFLNKVWQSIIAYFDLSKSWADVRRPWVDDKSGRWVK